MKDGDLSIGPFCVKCRCAQVWETHTTYIKLVTIWVAMAPYELKLCKNEDKAMIKVLEYVLTSKYGQELSNIRNMSKIKELDKLYIFTI